MSVYTKTARFDTGRPLTEDEMYRMAPSIFARTASPDRTDKFQPIATIDVMKALAKEGFQPFGVKQSLTRVPGREDFTRHLIRLRKVDDVVKYSVGDSVLEILLKNANDGSAAYNLMAGLFRIRCLNSMVAQTGTLEDVRVRHAGSLERVAGKVIEGTYSVLNEAQKVLEVPEKWSQIALAPSERLVLAKRALVLRFGDKEGVVDKNMRPDQLLVTRRREDNNTDLWTTFNVIQENAMQGGLRYRAIDNYGRPGRRNRTREVAGIDQSVKLNKALWNLAERMSELKMAA